MDEANSFRVFCKPRLIFPSLKYPINFMPCEDGLKIFTSTHSITASFFFTGKYIGDEGNELSLPPLIIKNKCCTQAGLLTSELSALADIVQSAFGFFCLYLTFHLM